MKTITKSNQVIAVLDSDTPLITDATSALDVIMSAFHESGASRVALRKSVLHEDFFILSSGIAGEVLQKFSNYRIKCAIFGDFTRYTSKPLRDFIYECNQGNLIYFATDEHEAIEWLVKP